MEEILELEEIWALVRRLYGKKKEGWTAYRRMTENKLIDFIVKGPDVIVEIVQDSPDILMLEDISRFPISWRPLGKGVVLDEDPSRVPSASERYGLRPVSRRTFETYMKIWEMIQREEEKEKILRIYDRMMAEHVRVPVAGYDEVYTPVASIGPAKYRPDLMDISASQRKLRTKLENQVRMMQRKRMSYVG